MDAIRKSFNFPQSILPEAQQTPTSTEQTIPQISSAGIASIPDTLENYQTTSLDLTNSTTTQNSDLATPDKEQVKVEASSIFDILTANPSDLVQQAVIPDPPPPVYSQDGAKKVEAFKTPEGMAITQMVNTFKTEFLKLAEDKERFHMVMKSIYSFQQAPNSYATFTDFKDAGLPDPYSPEKAEALRQRALSGDFNWLPKVEFQSRRQLGQSNGYYAATTPKATIYISDQLLKGDPEVLADSFFRGVGFHLDNLTDDPQVYEQGIQMAQDAIEDAKREGDELAKEPYITNPYWKYQAAVKRYQNYAAIGEEASGDEGETFRQRLLGFPWLPYDYTRNSSGGESV
jgi:hypothetical protein